MRLRLAMVLVAAALSAPAPAAPATRHHDFEADRPGTVPEGWFVPGGRAASLPWRRGRDEVLQRGLEAVSAP